MNVIVDFLMCFLAAAVFFLAIGRNTIVTAIRLGAAVLAIGTSVLAVQLGAPYLTEKLPNPIVNVAIEDLAELSGIDTNGVKPSEYITLLDYDVLKNKSGLDDLLNAYDVDRAGADQAAEAGVQAVAEYMALPLWRVMVETLLRLFVLVIVYGVLLAVLRTMLYRKFQKIKKKTIAPLTAVCALLAMVVVMSYVVVPVAEGFRPFTMRGMEVLQWDQACAGSMIYPLFATLYIL